MENMGQVTVLVQPFYALKATLEGALERYDIEEQRRSRFHWGWEPPNGTQESYKDEMDRTRQAGLIDQASFERTMGDMARYTQVIDRSLDGIVVIQRAPTFGFHPAIEAALVQYAQGKAKAGQVYVYPPYTSRLPETDDGISLADIDIFQEFLIKQFGSIELTEQAQYRFIGEDIFGTVMKACTDYIRFMQARPGVILVDYNDKVALHGAHAAVEKVFQCGLKINGKGIDDFVVQTF